MVRVKRVLEHPAGGLLLAAVVSGCAATSPQPSVLRPMASATTHEFFSNGRPVAVVQGHDCAMLLEVEPVSLGAVRYLRVWWLYANEGRDPVLIEPLADVSVVSHALKSGEERRVTPEPSSRILGGLDSEAAAQEISTTMGSLFQSTQASARDSQEAATPSGPDSTRLAAERGGASGDQDESAAARLACDLYGVSVNNGVLKRSTVLPGQGVHGYVYVPWPTTLDRSSLSGLSPRRVPASAGDLEHRVVIHVGAYADSVVFTPVAGECGRLTRP